MEPKPNPAGCAKRKLFRKGDFFSTLLGVATLVMAREERVLAIEGYGSDGVFDWVGVHLDAAIGQEDL